MKKKLVLPAIAQSAIDRPLSLDPSSGEFIYYKKVLEGEQKITPINQLNEDQLIQLVIERQFSANTNPIVFLNGKTFTREELVTEIQHQSKEGRQIFDADLNYLKFYLSSFPQECFKVY